MHALRCLVYEIHVDVRWDEATLGGVVTTIQRVVRCSHDRQCTAGIMCDRMITEYTDDEYGDTHSISQDITLVLNTATRTAFRKTLLLS
jgi:hypothetical protein